MLEFLAIPVVAGGVSLLFGKKWNDKQKLEKIFENTGLVNKEGEKMIFYRESAHDWGKEYVYKIPLGLSFPEIEEKIHHIEDGLNNKVKGQQKTVKLSYDGMVRIKVFEKKIPEKFNLDMNLINSCYGWQIPVGQNQHGFVYHDFDELPHCIVAGTTQWGKTVFLKMLTTTLISRQPDNVRFVFLDLKGMLSMNRFENLSQTVAVAADVKESLKALKVIKSDIAKRLKEFRVKGFENIRDSKIKDRMFIVVDEAAELSSNGQTGEEKKLRLECEEHLSYIARVAGGLGYRLIYATQAPYRNVISPQIKQNCDTKICFRLQTQKASEVVLDQGGAEKLPKIKGRCIYLNTEDPVILQTPYIENDFINEVITPHIVEKQSEKVVENEHNSTKQREDTRNIIEFI